MKKFKIAILPVLATVLAYAGCVSTTHTRDRAPQGEGDYAPSFEYRKPETPHLCAALRGNGTRIFATVESLAEITEHMGPIDGIVGASSGGAGTFLYESMLVNPAVRSCPDRDQGRRLCNQHEIGRRVSLLLRSFPGYMTTLATKTEQKSIFAAESLGNIKTEGLSWKDFMTGSETIGTVLGDPDINSLINPEIREMAGMKNVMSYGTAYNRIITATKQVNDFDANSNEAIFRPGLIKIEQLATLISRIGNFYANYKPSNRSGKTQYWDLTAWNEFLDECTPDESTPDMSWDAISKVPKGNSKTCQNKLDDLIVTYRHELMKRVDVQVNGKTFKTTAEEVMNPSRRTDMVGAVMHSMNSVSSLWKPGIGNEFKKQLDAYLNFQKPNFKPNFSDFRLSYFGDDQDLKKVASGLAARYSGDEKSEKFHPLPHYNWLQAMTRSASEPGLSHALRLDDDTVTFGGWMDAHATLALRAIGCEKVVYVTRAGTESDFAVSASSLFGSTMQDRANLFSLGRKNPLDRDEVRSSFAKSLNEADAIFCTNWNSAGSMDIAALTESARQATVVINDYSRSKSATDLDDTAESGLLLTEFSNKSENHEAPMYVYQSEVIGHPHPKNSGFSNKETGTVIGLYGCVDGAPPAPGEEVGEHDKVPAKSFKP